MGICKVDNFYDAIKNYRTIKDINKRIDIEVEYLNKSCGSVASLKRYLTMYRNYLRIKIQPSRQIGSKSLLDILLSKFTLNTKQQQTFKTNHVLEISNAQKNLRKIYDPQKFIDTGLRLLSSVSVYDRILGLCALTGRRPAEIGCTAILKPTEDKRLALFEGQLKVKDRENIQPYVIPLLGEYEIINNVLQSIRKQKPQFINKPLLFNGIASKELGIRVKRHFKDILEGDIQVKNLRAVYATIAYGNYCQFSSAGYVTVSMNSYFAQILGHGENDVVTCGSYIDFCLPK